MSQQSNISNLWQKLVDSETAYVQSRVNFLKNCSNKVSWIQAALHNPAQRGTALRLLNYLSLDDRQSLFQDVLELASVSHSDIDYCRQAILTLPKQWLLANIENAAETLLDDSSDEEYRRLLELYLQIDLALTQRLTIRALQHNNPDIREVGEDFDLYLRKGQLPLAV